MGTWEHIPQELKDLRQWTTWWATSDGRKGFAGKSNEPSTWRTFDQVKAAEKIAFVIGDRGEFVGVDLDDCFVDEEFTDQAAEILQAFAGVSYAEISPSGTGAKLLIRGSKPDWAVSRAGNWLECYDNRRFWCLTGQVIGPEWATIGQDDGQVEWLCQNWLRKPENGPVERTESPIRLESQASVWDRAMGYVESCPPAMVGGRDNAAYSLAGNLMAIVDEYGQGLTDEEVYQLLSIWNGRNPEPLSDHEIQTKVRSARQNGTPRELKRPEVAGWPSIDAITIQADDEEIDVNLDGFLDRSRESRNSTWPEALLYPPGFLGDVVRWINSQNSRPSPILALPGALALLSVLLGSKWKDKTGQHANLYLISVGGPGSGKAAPIRVVQDVLNDCNASKLWTGKTTSDSAIASCMKTCPTKLFIWDEFGKFLQKTKMAYGGGPLNSVQDAMLELWAPGKVWKQKTYSDSSHNKEIDNPFMSLLAATTPQTLWAGFDESNLVDGFSARLLVFVEPNYAPLIERERQDVPESILAPARWWLRFTENQGDMKAVHPGCRVIPDGEGASDIFKAMAQHVDSNHKDEVACAQWARAPEKARRLAMLYACSRDQEAPIVDRAAANWGCQVVEIATTQFLKHARREIGGSDHAAQKWRRILSFIVAESKQKRVVTRRQILRKFSIPVSEADKILTAMLEARQIALVKGSDAPQKGGKQSVYFRAID